MIKRYDVCEQGGNEYEIKNGRFVLYEDCKKLEEALKHALGHIYCNYSSLEIYLDHWKKEHSLIYEIESLEKILEDQKTLIRNKTNIVKKLDAFFKEVP